MSPRAVAAAGAAPDLAPDQHRGARPQRAGSPAPLEAVGPDTRRRSWQVGTLAGALLFVALFAIAGAQALIVQQQQHLDDVDARIETAQQESEQLRDDLAVLQSPERIIAEAKGLGMVEATPPLYLQPRATDDAEAAEVPPASPPTTTSPTTTTPTSTTRSAPTSSSGASGSPIASASPATSGAATGTAR